jgi:hypothetical protein
MKTYRLPIRSWFSTGVVISGLLALTLPHAARCQITPEEASQIRTAIGDRIEALTILGGDYGLAGASFRSTGKFSFSENTDATLDITKLGGAGEIGDPQPMGTMGIGWQPRLQGNMGYIDATNHLHSPLLEGDQTKVTGYGLEFGGGARFWTTDRFSVAPTVMALYGHLSNSYTANSAFMQANQELAKQMGLIDWKIDTITVVTAANFQYVINWDRTIVTLSSEPIWFHTETLSSSNSHVTTHGDSGTWANKIDVDAPLGRLLWGHELRSGGYFSRTDLSGGLKSGLVVPYMYEAHARLVLDFLNQLWYTQWLGLGGSYVWGPNIKGWTFGVDVTFRF